MEKNEDIWAVKNIFPLDFVKYVIQKCKRTAKLLMFKAPSQKDFGK